ncbi:MAG: hypothetical protein F4X39_02655, partial [Acidobacteriia bacterium]|nr:hypothetical protein [Terriglobia bacterium]
MTRRDLLAAAGFASIACQTSEQPAHQPKPRIAAITTVYFERSHADVFFSRILHGYRLNKKTYYPRLEVASMYLDQVPDNDMGYDLAEEYGFKVYPTVAETLRCGGDRLAVDGIALVAEHGEYPSNEKGQQLYPRYELFMQLIDVMKQDGAVCPIFVDKHFSYSWEKASAMYGAAKEMGIPLMAGSTVSLAWRYPPLELDYTQELEQALTVGFGHTDALGFHTLEALQAIVEKRMGGETGVESVQAFRGSKVWELRDQGVWSQELFEAALARTETRKEGLPEDLIEEPVLFLIDYRDGLKGRLLMANGLLRSWVVAASRKGSGEILSTECRIQFHIHGHWGFMARNFENLIADGILPNPVERTLLTTGVLSFA